MQRMSVPNPMHHKPKGRIIERSEFADYIDLNRLNVEKEKDFYRRRQAIVEHPYGTIKRQ